ncbi:MAG: helix-turn-helix domain-containing protein [Solirubrobacteraceae bacterium]
MAASGLSNREIAQALFVTEQTIEWHLGQTYRKLDVHSRHDLPKALTDLDQPPPASPLPRPPALPPQLSPTVQVPTARLGHGATAPSAPDAAH